ncbi:MAG: hydrogenase nickel incorporation protein HypB [Chitinivibrionales bacterium]|nr:hydrogenase nickel incorporation protein HypB [Chitinivibrionales bacterium]
MCEQCGCSEPSHTHGPHEHDHDHDHTHDHGHEHSHDHDHKRISMNVDVLKRNNELAARNRAFFDDHGVFVVNIISSPGSGKTTLLEALAERFGERMAVIEGDLQTNRDAERVIRAGSRAYQIQTNGACHLDAHSVGHALEHLDFDGVRLVVIENVGNLVCPAAYDLGEHEKVAILSLPEGDDKVLKYPALFHRISVLLINKIDLAPYLEFDVRKAINECRSLNRTFESFQVSGKTGEGMERFCEYLAGKAGLAESAA